MEGNGTIHLDSGKLKRRNINIHVEKGEDFERIGRMLATCIKRMEKQPELSAEDAFVEVILKEADGDAKTAARLGVQYGNYARQLSGGHGPQYFDLNIVAVRRGRPHEWPLDVEQDEKFKRFLTAMANVLGRERIKIRGVLDESAFRLLHAGLLDHDVIPIPFLTDTFKDFLHP